MLFSIIVPIYGVEEFLPQCIESILKQDYKNFELILVDDGSKDRSGKICDEYAGKDLRIKVFHKANGGLVSARKFGVAHAKGKYIVPVDGDDWIAPGLLTALLEVILRCKDIDIICYGNFQGNSKEQYKPKRLDYELGLYRLSDIQQKIYQTLIKDKDGKRFPPNLWGKAMKKESYQLYQMAVPDILSLGEDAAVSYPLISHADTIYIMHECFYYYRWNSKSMTKSRRKGFDWNNLRILAKVWNENLNKGYDFTDQINRYMCHDIFNVAKSHLQTKQEFTRLQNRIVEELNKPDFRYYVLHAEFDMLSLEQIPRILLKYQLVHIMKFLTQYI